MPAIQFPLVNGVRKDFSSITLNIAGRQFVGFTAINYTDSLRPGSVFGNSAQRLGRTRGQREISASLTMFRTEWKQLRELLLLSAAGYMEAIFDITVSYGDVGEELETDKLLSCRVTSEANNNAVGGEALTVDIELDVMDMLHNGLSPLTKPLLAPPV
jgi:hypothetical protein